MPRTHTYETRLRWTGAAHGGTTGYASYSRDHEIDAGDAVVPGSADPAYRGDPMRANPEQLLLGSLAACHMLWYLHLCADAGISVVAYSDATTGSMTEQPSNGRMERVTLHPHVVVRKGDDIERARALHHRAHDECFIANSVNFPVDCEPVIEEEDQ